MNYNFGFLILDLEFVIYNLGFVIILICDYIDL